MHELRQDAIVKAKHATRGLLSQAVKGALVINRIRELAQRQTKLVVTFLMSEIFPWKLAKIEDVDCFSKWPVPGFQLRGLCI